VYLTHSLFLSGLRGLVINFFDAEIHKNRHRFSIYLLPYIVPELVGGRW
jgi:hypothetical protein